MTPHRRGFLQYLASLPGLGAVLGGFTPAALAAAVPGRRDPYRELGVKPLINAAGTYTRLTASLLPREVKDAMEAAASQYVDIVELQQAAGKRIASLVGCEAALVTCGAASALTLATAACVAGKDSQKIRRIPDTTGMKNEVIIQKSHRFGYDHAVRNVGVRLVEVETREDLERAVNERTAMMLFLNYQDPVGQIQVEEFAQLGKKLNVPTLNDAAADVPPVENLSRYTKMGYDLVAFSGGKGLRGPQCSGLLLGRRDLIEAAMLNTSPNGDTVARTNKVGKEEIVGLWAAVELYTKQDHEAIWRDWEKRCKTIADLVAPVPGVKTEIFVPEIANHCPHLRLTWDYAASGLKPADVVRQLREGEPRIETRPGNSQAVEIAVWMLEPGQDRLVGRRLREVLKRA
jgi:L-seryl-tRNA(Ser) seleniumtransferase